MELMYYFRLFVLFNDGNIKYSGGFKISVEYSKLSLNSEVE